MAVRGGGGVGGSAVVVAAPLVAAGYHSGHLSPCRPQLQTPSGGCSWGRAKYLRRVAPRLNHAPSFIGKFIDV